MALQTINKCLSDAICAMARSMLDGESRAAALIHSGNEIMETARYSEARLLSSVLFFHKLSINPLCFLKLCFDQFIGNVLTVFKTRTSYLSNKLY